MSWTTPKTWTPGDVLSASELNTHLRDNPNYLLSGFAMASVIHEPASDYTTTAGSFVDVDATNLKLTLTVKGGRAVVYASFHLASDGTANSSGEATVLCDTATYPDGSGANGLVRLKTTGTQVVSLVAFFSGLAEGSHTFKLQFRNAAAGATTTIYKVNSGATNGSPITMFGLAW